MRVALMVLAAVAVCQHVAAYASSQLCAGSPSWQRGGPYNQMSIAAYSTSSTACVLTLSPAATNYSAGQQFTVTLTSTRSYGFKTVSLGGANLT